MALYTRNIYGMRVTFDLTKRGTLAVSPPNALTLERAYAGIAGVNPETEPIATLLNTWIDGCAGAIQPHLLPAVLPSPLLAALRPALMKRQARQQAKQQLNRGAMWRPSYDPLENEMLSTNHRFHSEMGEWTRARLRAATTRVAPAVLAQCGYTAPYGVNPKTRQTEAMVELSVPSYAPFFEEKAVPPFTPSAAPPSPFAHEKRAFVVYTINTVNAAQKGEPPRYTRRIRLSIHVPHAWYRKVYLNHLAVIDGHLVMDVVGRTEAGLTVIAARQGATLALIPSYATLTRGKLHWRDPLPKVRMPNVSRMFYFTPAGVRYWSEGKESKTGDFRNGDEFFFPYGEKKPYVVRPGTPPSEAGAAW